MKTGRNRVKKKRKTIIGLTAIFLGAAIIAGKPRHEAYRTPADSASASHAPSPWDLANEIDRYFLNRSLEPSRLHPGEKWKGGSAETELRYFKQDAMDVLAAQRRLARETGLGPGRVFHEKQHGCLIGTLKVLNHPGAGGTGVFQGIFAPENQSYTVLARLSNGVGKIQPDIVPDVRGIALKIFGVRDDATGRPTTVDFTMTNSPTPFGRDTEEFVGFMNASTDPNPLALPAFLARHLEVARRLAAATLKFTPSLTQVRFWAGHAYALNDHEAMKLNLQPEFPDAKLQPRPMGASQLKDLLRKLDPDYLGKDLATRAAAGPIRYVFNLQLGRGLATTPIEDNLQEWKESDTPSLPVAELIFEPQRINDAELEETCRQARFTPDHFVSQHRPLSEMGRGRRILYTVSQLGRGASPADPSESFVKNLLQKIRISK